MKLPSMLKPSHWISPLRARQLHRAYGNLKLTLVCGLLTIVVLRGTFGAGSGNFGSPVKDFEEIRHQFEKVHLSIHTRKLKHVTEAASEERHMMPAKVIEPQSQHSSDNNMNIAHTLADTIALQGSAVHYPASKSAKVRSKFNHWDTRHQAEVKVHGKRHKVMMVTDPQPSACASPDCDQPCLLTPIKNKVDYCRIHDFEIFYSAVEQRGEEMPGFSTKLANLRKFMLLHPHVQWFWWIDSDAVFTDMAFELPLEKYEDYDMVLHGWDDRVSEQDHWVGFNTGSFLLRNSQWSLEMLDAWSRMEPLGPATTDEAGNVWTEMLKGRQRLELDDQSALMNVLVNERAKLGDKVLLERSHGYWKFVVGKNAGMRGSGQEMGDGDGSDWPVVTHFVGCEPCSNKEGDPDASLCVKHMERAINQAAAAAAAAAHRLLLA